MVTLYNVVSSDGFIARKNGSEDFIPDSFWPLTLQELKKYDCIIMGRKTYEVIQSYEKDMKDSFGVLPGRKFVITHDKNLNVEAGYEIALTPEKVINKNLNIVVTSGPDLNNYLLNKGLVDRIAYHAVQESISEGIKPYDILNISLPLIRLN